MDVPVPSVFVWLPISGSGVLTTAGHYGILRRGGAPGGMTLRRITAVWALCLAFALAGTACADTSSGTSGPASSPLGVGGGSLSSAAPTPASVVTTPAPAPAQPVQPVQPPVQPATVTFVNAPLSARHGQATTLIAKTSPSTGCSIRVEYKSGPSHAQGLVARTSDGAGNISWTWIVGSNTTPGQWPIYVACGSASAQTYITVT
jgi:micrococcal nuclease